MRDELISFYDEHATWDPMLVRQGDHWFLYVMAARKGVDQERFFVEPNHIHGFSSTDLKHWVDLGIIVGLPGDSGRLCAGNTILADGRFHFFFSATIKQLSTDHLDQRIFLATSMDGRKYTLHNQFSLPPDPVLYKTRRFNPQTGQMMFSWRDPFCIRDPRSGRYYLFICCGGFRWGIAPNIAVGVADRVTGPYTLLPNAVEFPVEQSKDTLMMPVSEIERVQILCRDGRYFIIFSTWKHYANEAWFRSKLGVDAELTNSTIYVLTSDNIAGPYRFYTRCPVVQGSERTSMYGTILLEHPNQPDLYQALGWYPDSFRVEVSGHYNCKWSGDKLKLFSKQRLQINHCMNADACTLCVYWMQFTPEYRKPSECQTGTTPLPCTQRHIVLLTYPDSPLVHGPRWHFRVEYKVRMLYCRSCSLYTKPIASGYPDRNTGNLHASLFIE